MSATPPTLYGHKFYGDVNQQLTDIITALLFFELELNRIDDEVMAHALETAELRAL